MTDTEPASVALQVQGVSRSYGSVQALSGVDWCVQEGGIHGLVGPNGAGKTTLLSVTCGFLPADTGTVHIRGVEVTPGTPPTPGLIGVLPQDAALPHRQKIGPVLAYYGRLMGLGSVEAAVEARRVLKLVGLEEVYSRRPRTLSHGMYKRVGIAQSLIGSPAIILLDEPTAGLDPNAAREVRSLLRGLRAHGTIVVSSHNLAEIEDLCSEVTILHQGAVARQDEISALVGETHEISFRLTEPPTADLLQGIRELDCTSDAQWDPDTDRLRVCVNPTFGTAAEASQVLIAHLAGMGAAFVELQIGATLEDRFTQETG